MGCFSSKPELDSLEQQYFHPFESQLGLSVHHSKQIDRIFHRFSFNKLMTENQLKQAVNALNISVPYTSVFFFYFKESQKFSVTKLSTLGILTGKGSIQEKSEILFENYDLDTSGLLEISEIHTMVNDLIRIACEIIPRFVCDLNKEDEDLLKFSKKMRTVVNYLTGQYRERIMEDRISIDKNVFVQRIESLAEVVFKMSEIRKECFEIYKKNLKPLELVIQSYDRETVKKDLALQRYFSMHEDSPKKKVKKMKTHSHKY